jgi:hypothetical protein
MQVLKVPFWQFFREGRDGRALLVWPLRIPSWISKIIFVLSSYEFLSMLAKLERAFSFRFQKINKYSTV